MDHPSGAPPRAGRPLELADLGGLYATAPGSSVRGRPEVALGEALRPWPVDPVSSPPRRFGAFAAVGYAREAAKPLRALAGTTQRPPFGSSEALPGTQEDRLIVDCSEVEPCQSWVHQRLPSSSSKVRMVHAHGATQITVQPAVSPPKRLFRTFCDGLIPHRKTLMIKTQAEAWNGHAHKLQTTSRHGGLFSVELP
jgi:hypothetical protein